jgi:peptide deformylase
MIIRKADIKLVPENHPALHKPPQPYDFEQHGATAQLFANVMFEKMKEFKGVGLSANQVGLDVAFFVIGVDDVRLDIFNPKIISSSGECDYNEGCLSYIGVTVRIKRPEEIVVEYQNTRGEVVNRTLGGLTARIFQHEYDHMQGLTIKTKVSSMKWNLALKKSKKTSFVV